jgi:hypothetical protein
MTIHHTRIATFIRTVAVATAVVMPAAVFAQTNAARGNIDLKDVRWQPWLGCWTPIERAPRDRDIQVCVTPAAGGAGVHLMTFAGDQRILDDSITADGSAVPMSEEACRGSSRSQWAKKAPRLYRVTELACADKPSQRTAEIATLESADEWLDVQVVLVGGNENVRTRRYVRSTLAPPIEVRDQVSGLSLSRAVAVNSTVTVNDVIEAQAAVSSRAVEAWLSETDAQVPVHKDALLALHNAKVPPNVIDLMIARAYPSHFEVRRSGGGGGGSVGSFFDDVFWASPFDLMFDPYAFFYSPFGSYHGFVDPSLYGYGGYVIVPANTGGSGGAQDAANARVVNGMGYTRVEPRQPAVFVGPRPPGGSADSYDSGSGSSEASSSSSSSGGGSASSAGYSAGGGGSQTAVPR